ncbi:MAG: hypothetical protein ACREAA_11895 [Candidatus Polarisedimenticolia bacterium]
MSRSSHDSGKSHRHRRRRRPTTDPYVVCLACMAVLCVLMVVAMLISRPQWDTPVLGLPLGSFLLGGLGGLLTLGVSPSWARRLGSDPVRVIGVIGYRLVVALAAGGLGYALISGLMGEGESSGMPPHLAALLAGVMERPINDGVLKAVGVLEPREESPQA